MSDWQKRRLEQFFCDNSALVSVFAHGCCIGADIEAHAIVRRVLGSGVYVAIFPSTAKTRASVPIDANYVAPPKPPLDRNRDIVTFGRDLLIAAPLQDFEVLRSGTWATVRFAKSKKINVLQLKRDQP